jgi:hypothetical protein
MKSGTIPISPPSSTPATMPLVSKAMGKNTLGIWRSFP